MLGNPTGPLSFMSFPGKCEREIERYCDDVDEGEGHLADCISNQISSSEAPDNGDGEFTLIGPACTYYGFAIT